MARFFSGAKVLSALITSRGFSAAAAPQGVVSKAGAAARNGAGLKRTGEEVVGSTEKVSWVPDPRTGYYRPENATEVIDVAELLATLLKKH